MKRRSFIGRTVATVAGLFLPRCGDMAARAPTSFALPTHEFSPRKPVLAAATDDYVDNQQLVLDKNEVVIADTFENIVDTTGGGWSTVRRYFTRAPDMCGTAATINAEASLRVLSVNAANYDIAIYHAGRAVRHSITISANHTLDIWRAWIPIVLYGTGAENELLIQVDDTTSPGGPFIYLQGVAIFTDM